MVGAAGEVESSTSVVLPGPQIRCRWYQVFAATEPLSRPALPLPATKTPPIVLVTALGRIIGCALPLSMAAPGAMSITVLGEVASLESVRPERKLGSEKTSRPFVSSTAARQIQALSA